MSLLNKVNKTGLDVDCDKRICLLDLNYTLVANQMDTRQLTPFSKHIQKESYRIDLIDAIKNDFVIIITARPKTQQEATMANILKKTGWQPMDMYFNDIDAAPPVFKESALKRFVFPKYGTEPSKFYAVESNPETRAMYERFGIKATPYELFSSFVHIRNKGQERPSVENAILLIRGDSGN